MAHILITPNPTIFERVQQYSKFVVALLTVLVTSGVGLIPGEYIGWVQFAIAILGAVAIYQVENKVIVNPSGA